MDVLDLTKLFLTKTLQGQLTVVLSNVYVYSFVSAKKFGYGFQIYF